MLSAVLGLLPLKFFNFLFHSFGQPTNGISGQPTAQPPLPPTSPPQTPPLPPLSSVPIPSSAALVLHDAIQGQEGSSEMDDPNTVFHDSEVRGARAMRGGSPSAEASMRPIPEVRMQSLTL